jgi:hypothetical protein
MKHFLMDLNSIGLLVLAALVSTSSGCKPAVISTPNPTLKPEATPTSIPTSTPQPTLVPSATPTTPPPEPGEWNNFAENLGWFTFTVSSDSGTVTLVSVQFDGFICQGRGISGKWMPEGYLGNVANRNFTLGGTLAGYMELSFTGMRPGVNPFPAITFSGEFDTTGTNASGTWAADWEGVSCSGTWISTEGKPPPVSTTSPAEPYYVYPFCNCQEDVPASLAPTLRWGWITTTETYCHDFIRASKSTVTIDGTTYTDLEGYWGDVAYSADDGGYKSLWIWELPPLTAGLHLVEFSVSLDRAVTDGYDGNGDGKEDQYGPGEVFFGWVELQIEVTSGSSSTACPNGAPAGHWKLIVEKSSAGDGTINIDGEAVPIKSGENSIHLTVDQSHAILVGTNTINYSAPECGENTVSVP